MRKAHRAVMAAGATVALATTGTVPAVAAGARHHHGHETEVQLTSTSLGKVLANQHGRVMYLFMKDGRNDSNCSGACVKEWPRVKSGRKPKAEDGVSQAKLKVIAHNQVTYHGHPLYYFDADTGPGQSHGEGVFAFGGYWYVVTASGKAG